MQVQPPAPLLTIVSDGVEGDALHLCQGPVKVKLVTGIVLSSLQVIRYTSFCVSTGEGEIGVR